MEPIELPIGVSSRLAELKATEDSLLDLAMQCLTAHEGAVYPMDLLANGASNRALALSSGFRHMIEARNLVCAGSLLRMQLDTALRFHAAWLVEDCHQFAIEVLKGTRVDKLTDRDGKRLHDSYLVERMSQEDGCDWIQRVYRETSGYVHLSDKHIFQTLTSVDDNHRTVEIKIGAVDHEWPEDIYLEVVDAFLAATALFNKYLHGWGFTKQNPQEIARLREERQAKSSET